MPEMRSRRAKRGAVAWRWEEKRVWEGVVGELMEGAGEEKYADARGQS